MDEITKVECYFSGKDYIANIIVIIVIVSFLEKKNRVCACGEIFQRSEKLI